jgi:DNA topoisomerase-1
VWIATNPNGHLQATGRDVRRRKQYRYHPKWSAVRDENKFGRIVSFGKKIPRIRKTIQEHLSLPGLPREKVLATVVQLLEKTLIRIGNQEYAKANNSYGLTTLKDKHVKVSGATLKFQFRGKSGKEFSVGIADRRLAKIIRKCQELPGQRLFQYQENEEYKAVESADVNEYLRNIAGEEFSAKDFRTWAGTVLAALALQEFEKFDSETQAKKNVVEAIRNVAKRLGNTPAICRKCYIHPAVMDAYLDGEMANILKSRTEKELTENLTELSPEEAAVLAFLEKRLQKAAA